MSKCKIKQPSLDIDAEQLDLLVRKYSTSVPRYTSYPTAVEFHSGVDSTVWQEELGRDTGQKDTGQTDRGKVVDRQTAALYVHVPFCRSLCYFCACNKKIVKDDSGVAPYLSALSAELRKYKQILPSIPALQQLHWGGGTPNFLSPDASKELFGICKDAFPDFTETIDASVEIDPRTTTTNHLETYRNLGFTRISAGVQDFSPEVQEAINRVQPYELTREVCETIRALGFSGLNLDLIYGLPKQTETSFDDTVAKLLTLRPDRIALYGYAHVTWKKKVQRTLERHMLPSPELRIRLFLKALFRLLEAGYVYIGMDHFALPDDNLAQALSNGSLNRNFMGYSTHRGSNVYGIGVSAVSSTPNILAQNTADLDEYMKGTTENGFAISRGILRDREDQMRGEVIENILCQGKIFIPDFESTWQTNFHSKFNSELQSLSQLVNDGLLTYTSTSLEVTPLGRLFLRNIAAPFDAYFGKHNVSSEPVFSQSV